MTTSSLERIRMAGLGWLATVAMSLSIFPALSEKRYLVLGALLTGAVVVVGALLRLARTPALVVVVVQALVLFELLVLGFGTSLAYGLLPTRETVSEINDVLVAGMDTAQAYAAPTPKSTGLLLMVLFLIGLVGLLVDIIAVTMRRVPLAGLPLLALYAVPVAALPDGVPFYGFIPGAAAYIAILTADERDRLSHWGRLVSRGPAQQRSVIDLSSLRANGQRIGLMALSAAVVLPIFLPTLPATLLDGSKGNGPGDGIGATLSFKDPMVSLATSLQRKEEVDLLSITGDEMPQYLRLTTLDEPGPDAWSTTPVNLAKTMSLSAVLPSPTGLAGGVAYTGHHLNITPTDEFPIDSGWLPVPFVPTIVQANSNFGYVSSDQTVTVRVGGAIQELDSYSVDYNTLEPTPEQLRAAGPPPGAIIERYGSVSINVPPVVASTAAAVTSGADNPYDQAVLLQSFFRERGEFVYDVKAAYGYGYRAMADFLQDRRGFCQQFAATMAMMARTLGIPSRVVVGFLQPSDREGSRYLMTSHDVHSWPELYFDGVGWVRFEPTPGNGATVPSYAPSTAVPETSGITPSTSAPPTLATGPTEDIRDRPDAAGNTADDANSSSGSGWLSWWLLLPALVALALVPAGLRLTVRRSRITRPIGPAAAAESAWDELRDYVIDLRLGWVGSMTPRARVRSLAPLLDGDRDGLAALRRLALSVERARYAAAPTSGSTPSEDVQVVTGVLSSKARRGQRWRAVLLPASLVPDLRNGWERMRVRLSRGAIEPG